MVKAEASSVISVIISGFAAPFGRVERFSRELRDVLNSKGYKVLYIDADGICLARKKR